MNFKALIFDLDGTIIEPKIEALPSIAVIEAVKKAQEKLIVSIATGRQLPRCKAIIQKLQLKHPCIVASGTEIINPQIGAVLWTKKIEQKDVQTVLEICKSYICDVLFGHELKWTNPLEKKVEGNTNVVYILNTDPKDTQRIISNINLVKNVVAHEAGSWTEGKIDIHVTHKDATKKNALIELLKILKLNKEDVIAVGDNKNDLPLFEEAGFRVAVGNATEELKLKADYIAPSVFEDGLADVINKFILNI